MNRGFTLFELLMAVGMVQGLVTAILLLVSKRNPVSNRFLAGGIFLFCLINLKILLNSTGLTETLMFRYFPLGIELGGAPFIYFYVVSLITPDFKFRRRDWLHFLPLLISQTYAFWVYISAWPFPTVEAKDLVGTHLLFDPIKRLEDYLAVVSIFSYLSIGFFKMRTYRQRLNATTSDNSLPTFRWLMNIYLGSAILGALLFGNLLVDFLFDVSASTRTHWHVYFLYLTVLIYTLAFAGYNQPHFDLKPLKTYPEPKTPKVSTDKMEALSESVQEAMTQDRLYLNPTLSAHQLATHLCVSQTALSQAINRTFGKSFRDFVNAHRVEEVKRRLLAGDRQRHALLAIALDSGFNSEASFYRAFKKFTGQLPSEFGPDQSAN